jgi:hypothetical protein
MDFFRQLLMFSDFQPHNYCYRWNSGLVWLNVLSDTLIALAYSQSPSLFCGLSASAATYASTGSTCWASPQDRGWFGKRN